MVRSDGVIFHPDQLNRWAQLHPEYGAACTAAIETLKALRSRGANDLTQTIRTDATGPASSERVAAAKALLQRAKVDYYSDLDLVEVVDFASGEREYGESRTSNVACRKSQKGASCREPKP